MKTIIKTVDLCKEYKHKKILDNVNLKIQKGDIYGFVGRNGAGKTTLMRILMGLSFSSSGEFELLECHNPLDARKRISAVIETPAFYTNMTAEQNLKNHCFMSGIQVDKIDHALELVNLSNEGRKKVKHFSLGMKQRLAIAKALMNNSELIILDEPTNGLDPQGIEELRQLIYRLNREKKVTFFISSHYLTELQNVATRFGFIEKGTLCEEIEKSDLEKQCNKHLSLEAYFLEVISEKKEN